jgi:hypothetical protein
MAVVLAAAVHLAAGEEVMRTPPAQDEAPPDGADTHDLIFDAVQTPLQRMDRWFLGEFPMAEPAVSPFRVTTLIRAERYQGEVEWDPQVDVRIDLNMPYFKYRTGLVLTTLRPDALPSDDQSEQHSARPRLALAHWLPRGWNASTGVRIRIPPDPYASLSWRGFRALSERADLHPRLRLFWQLHEGFGVTGSLLGDLRHDRWVFRAGPGARITQRSEGLEGDFTVLAMRMREVNPYARDQLRMQADDLARGEGIRLSVRGATESPGGIREGRVTVFHHFPVWRPWLYGSVSAGLSFRRDRDWDPVPNATVALHAFFYRRLRERADPEQNPTIALPPEEGSG